ncbi:phosphopantetheine-binding protein [Verminephrobacter aporrectodeae]|uniref:phosphopantetheine-binding protein n=1 Tax=Verminephrobacter aporrectodeae TaxID=1110389 RepID=UPI00145F8433|nr:phosphopantetheine-binding protein [Verminephrobacter aporrectodeae]
MQSTFEQLVLDSLDFVELQVAVKKTYKVDLLPDMFVSGTISSMEQLVGFISSKMSTVQA